MVLNKSIKHQMFLKYDFQPQDMVFDMNSIIITIQNANSTTNDVPANVSGELFTSYTFDEQKRERERERKKMEMKAENSLKEQKKNQTHSQRISYI